MQVVYAPAALHDQSLFLGGSITGATDWQADFIKKFEKIGYSGEKPYDRLKTDLVIFNPRRDSFDVTNKIVEEEQIEWEFRHLRMADAVLFWFAKETLAPITLFELGRHSIIAGRPVFFGADPQYARIRDVEIQMQLINPRQRIRHTIDQLVEDVWSWLAHKEFYDYGRSLGY